MPLISQVELVNDTDETLLVPPGETVDASIVLVGNRLELRSHQ